MFQNLLTLIILISSYSTISFAHHLNNDIQRGNDLFHGLEGAPIHREILYNAPIGENYYTLIRRYISNRDKNFNINITLERLVRKAVENSAKDLDLDAHALELATRVIELPTSVKQRTSELQSSYFIQRLADITHSFSEGHAKINLALLEKMTEADNDVVEVDLVLQLLEETDLINRRLSIDPELPAVIKDLLADTNAMNDGIRNHSLVTSVLYGAYLNCSSYGVFEGYNVEACNFAKGEYQQFISRVHEASNMSKRQLRSLEHRDVDYLSIRDREVNLDRSALKALF